MKLFTCAFIRLKTEDYLHHNQSLKKKAKFCPKKFPMKTKNSILVKVGLHRWKTFYGIPQLNVNGEKLSVDEVEAILYCDELTDIIFDLGYCMIKFLVHMKLV